MKLFFVLIFSQLFFTTIFGQPSNDNCSDAITLCPSLITEGTTNSATLENCGTLGGCADDFPNFGIVPSASVWYKFQTNAVGGLATINVTNIQFNTNPNYGQALQSMLFSVTTPCQGEDFVQFSNVIVGATTDYTITSLALLPNTTYYLLIDGAITAGATLPADATFDIEIAGMAIDVPVLPTASISVLNTDICQGSTEPIAVLINDCNGSVSNKWYYNNTFQIDSSGFNTAVLSENGYLKLLVSCGDECVYNVTTDSIYFNLTPIEVDAGEDKLIELGESVVLNGSGTNNPVWTPETGLAITETFTPTATPAVTTTYFLTVSSDGCELTDEVVVKIKEIITIPSGFTPNGDGVNDVWEILNIDQYSNNSVIIYDRAGQVVFKTVNYNMFNNFWDGTDNGSELPVSTYFYVVDLKNGDSAFKGPVTIVK